MDFSNNAMREVFDAALLFKEINFTIKWKKIKRRVLIIFAWCNFYERIADSHNWKIKTKGKLCYNCLKLQHRSFLSSFSKYIAAVNWLKYCRYGVNNYPINQSINRNTHGRLWFIVQKFINISLNVRDNFLRHGFGVNSVWQILNNFPFDVLKLIIIVAIL